MGRRAPTGTESARTASGGEIEERLVLQVTTSKRLVLNTFFNILTAVGNSLVAFFVVRLFLGHLGEARYGIWVLVGSVFRYRYALGLGLNSAINRYIPVYQAKGDREGVEKVISTTLLFFLMLSLVLAAATLVIYHYTQAWFTIEARLVRTAELAVLIVGLCYALGSPLQIGTATLSGLQRYDVSGVVALTLLVVRTTLAVILLRRGFGLLTMGFLFGISEILGQSVECLVARRLLPGLSLGWRKVDLRLLRSMLSYGINTFLYMTSALIIYKASNLVIGIFLGTSDVSRFDVASMGVALLSQFLLSLTTAIKPAVSDLDARDDRQRVREIAFLTQKYGLLFIIPASCFLVVMGKDFLRVWVGDRFSDPGTIDVLATVMTILTIGHSLRLAQHSSFLVLAGRGQHKVFGAMTVAMATLCVAGSVVSVKLLHLGLVGIAWANFVPMLLISGVALPIYFNWKMSISARESISRVWRPAVLGSLPSVAIIALWKIASPPDSWSGIFQVVVAAAGATFAFGWLLGLESAEKERMMRILSFGRLKPQT
jgi:O-antigen/teichoic acid export membrane protein